MLTLSGSQLPRHPVGGFGAIFVEPVVGDMIAVLHHQQLGRSACFTRETLGESSGGQSRSSPAAITKSGQSDFFRHTFER